jgi:hypothetical protein
MLSAVTAGHLAAESGASRKDGVDHGLLLVGHEFYGKPIDTTDKILVVN